MRMAIATGQAKFPYVGVNQVSMEMEFHVKVLVCEEIVIAGEEMACRDSV